MKAHRKPYPTGKPGNRMDSRKSRIAAAKATKRPIRLASQQAIDEAMTKYDKVLRRLADR